MSNSQKEPKYKILIETTYFLHNYANTLVYADSCLIPKVTKNAQGTPSYLQLEEGAQLKNFDQNIIPKEKVDDYIGLYRYLVCS